MSTLTLILSVSISCSCFQLDAGRFLPETNISTLLSLKSHRRILTLLPVSPIYYLFSFVFKQLKVCDPSFTSLYRLGNFIGEWMGGLFQLFWERGRDFQELDRCSLFGLLCLASEMSQRLWVCYLACWCIKICWGSRSNRSQLIHHLGLIWL